MAQNREYRSFAEVREAGDEYRVEGYASTFEPYEMCEIEGEKYFERIEPTAFDECDMSDVVLRVDHAGAVYARTSAGTLTVNVDAHGLHTEADLSRTANSRALYDDIKAGNYPQMSFCFVVPEGGDHFDEKSRTRIVSKVSKLFDVSPVSFPANPTTELHARALEYFNGEIEKLKAERPEEAEAPQEVIEERIEQEETAETSIVEPEAEERAVETAEESAKEAEDRKAAEFAEYRALQQKVADGVIGKVVESHREEIIMEEKKYTPDTQEYRDAFYAVIGDYATAEQRAIVVDSTAPGDGDAIAIPKTLDEKIWDNIHTAHPILADIATVRSGVAMEVTKHTTITVRTTKKLDSAATPAEEANTFVKVVLYGNDYEKYVTLTYAEAKMSQGALEDYLAEEISAELGEALAKDVFAQILTDAGNGQKVTPAEGSDLFENVKAALALATGASRPVIYAPASSYYNIIAAIKSGNPFNIGNALGAEVKLDNAATKVTIVDPKKFVLNEVQPVMIESDRDIKAHKVVVSGYLRAQGTLRHNKAAAYIN
ncbi:MAG: phage major capsid protein [Prevotella sp.]|nr:phage major capsid protein [Prevotella sp.]MBR2096639.1 phage major capsid protein [Prevotella sp.]